MNNPLTATALQIVNQYATAMRSLQLRRLGASILDPEFTFPDTAEAAVRMLYYVAFCTHSEEDVQLFRKHELPSVQDARQQVARLRGLLGKDELLQRYDGYLSKL